MFKLLLIVLLAVQAQAQGDTKYIKWLEDNSRLEQARNIALTVSGSASQWRNSYAAPKSKELLGTASVWFTAYPNAILTDPGEKFIRAFSEEKLWKMFRELGVQAVHTGPIKRAGGIDGYDYTPTIDGWFDQISLDIDPAFGTDADYKTLSAVAKKYGAILVGDIIPGHTGKGADFRLAERGYKDYPGLYTMVEIAPEHWGLLPEVPKGADSANLSPDSVKELTKLGYIPGSLERVLFSVPGKPVTGWDATAVVAGAAGKNRRWVYLHYFKPGQPTLNWLDPSFAANRLIAADIVKSLRDGTSAIRLDANPFLGIEPRPGTTKAWSESHPLSAGASNQIAWLVRKMGGYSFQELNMGIEDIKTFSRSGPDMSYDFITRPAYNHALLTGDAGFLRLMLKLLQDYGIKPSSLIHALQNHDEITYELVHFLNHSSEKFSYNGRTLTGKELRAELVDSMHSLAVGKKAPYNMLSGNGLCTTYTGLAAAALGVKDIYSMSVEQVESVKNAHLLMAMYNALQPGIFAVSGWDLVGALPLAVSEIPELVADGDYRWINRGAYDLTGGKTAVKTATGLPKARALYGPVPEQLKDPASFASRLKVILDARAKYRIATAEMAGVAETTNTGVVALVNKLENGLGTEITILNFSRQPAEEVLSFEDFKGKQPLNIITGEFEGAVSGDGKLAVKLDAWQGKALLLK